MKEEKKEPAGPGPLAIDPIRERLERMLLAARMFDERSYLFGGITSKEIQELCLALLPRESPTPKYKPTAPGPLGCIIWEKCPYPPNHPQACTDPPEDTKNDL